jgi:tetratricopeptide (TPR) repeat protein
MKFNKLISCVLVMSTFMVGCASTPEKKPVVAKAEAAVAPATSAASVSALPAGPATPNPYLQNKPSVSRQASQNFTDATRAMRNKQWSQAESLLQKVIAENNKFSGAYLNLGLVYRAQKEDKRAEQAFNDAIAANHTNLDAYNQLAILQRESGRFAEAESNYKKALSVWSFHPESHKNLAILYDLYMGKSAEALPHYEAYLQLIGGNDKQAISWIADLQRRLGIAPKAKAATPAEASSTATDVSQQEVSQEEVSQEEVNDE